MLEEKKIPEDKPQVPSKGKQKKKQQGIHPIELEEEEEIEREIWGEETEESQMLSEVERLKTFELLICNKPRGTDFIRLAKEGFYHTGG